MNKFLSVCLMIVIAATMITGCGGDDTDWKLRAANLEKRVDAAELKVEDALQAACHAVGGVLANRDKIELFVGRIGQVIDQTDPALTATVENLDDLLQEVFDKTEKLCDIKG